MTAQSLCQGRYPESARGRSNFRQCCTNTIHLSVFKVLTDCMIHFSQREVFDDRQDLRPEVANFGTAQEIRAFMDNDPVLTHYEPALKEAVISHVLNTPGREEELIREAQGRLTGPEQFAVLCLAENSSSRRMWNQYASNGTGFVFAFNSYHPALESLKSPG